MGDMQIRKISIDKLNPAKYNPRVDLQPGDKDYEKLLRSVEEFGYVEPVIWNSRTGNIVGGHQRFKVLQHLGYTEIDCVVVDMDEVREKMLNVALNRIQGDWDRPKLYTVITDIESAGMEIPLLGFETQELDKLYQEVRRESGEYKDDDFDADAEAEKITEPITQLGDIWLIGKHRLMCGDSTNIEQVATLMDGKKAQMSFCDPPWNVDYGGSAHPSWKKRTIMNDKMSADDFYSFLLSSCKALASACEPGAILYLAMSAQEWGSCMAALKESGFHWSSTIIWYKDSLVLSRKDYHTQYEPIWYGWLEGKARLVELKDRGQSDVWEIPRPKKSEEHPTMKPVALVAKTINNSSRDGDIVLDLFGGSGTTLLAAEQCDRVARLMELDPKYCDVIVKRFIAFKESDEGIFLLRNGEKTAYHNLL